MKIGFFGDGAWSHEALKKILSNNLFKINFIVPRYNSPDPVLKKISNQNNIDYLIFNNVNDNTAINQIADYNCDILVSMSYDQIIKKKLINLSPKGFINCHAGALPFYRGRNVLNWVLINDEDNFGITVHYIDEGIDTGDIIIQKKFPISDEDDYSTLLNVAYNNCADILLEALKMIKNSNVNRLPQKNINAIGSYCRKRIIGDEYISWEWSSRKIFNFVRSITLPGPIARSKINNNYLFIKKSKLIKEEIKSYKLPGTVIKIDNSGILVKTIDNALLITEYFFKSNESIKLNVNDVFINQ